MLNPVAVSVDSVRQPQRPPSLDGANNVFKVLHGMYGNLFLSKFATGDVDESTKQDKGIAGARQIWAHGLRDFDGETIGAALRQCMEAHREFPPSLPQFRSLCMANKPRETAPAGPAQIGMSQELRSQYARQARAIIEKHEKRVIERVTGYKPLPLTLDGLKQAIANAIGAAGGDEAATLMRLDRELSPQARAAS